MKVLSPGDQSKIWSAEITCTWCDAVLGINEADLHVKESNYMQPGTNSPILISWVRCPECGCNIRLTHSLPHEVASRNLSNL